MSAVLVTGMGSTTAISVCKALKQITDISIKIIGVDINLKNEIAGSILCDTFYTVPLASQENYIEDLIKICKIENVQIVFPIVDDELEVISYNLHIFEEHNIFVWLSNYKTILTCNNKYKTYQFFIENGFKTPKTWLPKEINFNDLLYPLIVKPINGRGSQDVYLVNNPKELEVFVNRVRSPIIQEYIDGKEFTIDIVADQFFNILATVPRERIETKSGICSKGKTVNQKTLIKQSQKIINALKIKGACNLQCRMRQHEPIFIEINPRFSAGLPLTVASGVNSPEILVKLALGKKLDKEYYNFQAGTYMTRYWEEVFYSC